jgi:hypothetical protein
VARECFRAPREGNPSGGFSRFRFRTLRSCAAARPDLVLVGSRSRGWMLPEKRGGLEPGGLQVGSDYPYRFHKRLIFSNVGPYIICLG